MVEVLRRASDEAMKALLSHAFLFQLVNIIYGNIRKKTFNEEFAIL